MQLTRSRDLGHAEVFATIGLGSSSVGGGSGGLGRCILVSTSEVVDHLCIKLFNSLGLTAAGVATLTALAGATLTL